MIIGPVTPVQPMLNEDVWKSPSDAFGGDPPGVQKPDTQKPAEGQGAILISRFVRCPMKRSEKQPLGFKLSKVEITAATDFAALLGLIEAAISRSFGSISL